MRKIIDTHLHTWDLENLDYYWLKGDTSILAQSYALTSIEPEFGAAGVSAAVLVQATNSLAETDWLLELCRQYEWLLGAVVWLPLAEPKEVEKLLAIYQKNPFFKGVRHQIHDEADPKWLLQPNVLQSLNLLAEQNIPYDLVGISHYHIQTALNVAERIPALKMVFDHLNQLPVGQNPHLPDDKWEDLMKQAGHHPNFYAKISGLGTAIKKDFDWSAEDIKPFILFILECFGNERVFCGGDWPVSLLAGTYPYTWQQYQLVLDNVLNQEQQDLLYYKNAERFYNLKY